MIPVRTQVVSSQGINVDDDHRRIDDWPFCFATVKVQEAESDQPEEKRATEGRRLKTISHRFSAGIVLEKATSCVSSRLRRTGVRSRADDIAGSPLPDHQEETALPVPRRDLNGLRQKVVELRAPPLRREETICGE